MNAREIENLRKKFIWVAFLSLVLAMFLVSLTIDFATYISSQRVIRQALDTIADAGGVVSEEKEQSPAELVNDPSLIEVFAPVLSSYSDYFVILCEEDAETVSVIWNHGGQTAYTQTAADSEDDGSEAAGEDRAPDYHGIAQRVIEDGRTYGRAGRLYYKLVKSDTGYVIAFLDASAEVTLFSRLLFLSGAACFIGFLITYILVRIFSRKMIEPEIENSRRQKQFITNASHELKTPLAVIRANTELSEMLHGEDEWSRSTMRQVDRMDGLIRSLVQIAKNEETENEALPGRINVSEAVEEASVPYIAVAESNGFSFVRTITPDLFITIPKSQIEQLAAILLDNAVKYCDPAGEIGISLQEGKRNKGVVMTVSNAYKDGENQDLGRFFDRFYREDNAHSIDKGGYGIGLSIAEGICEKYGGSIETDYKDGEISFICRLSGLKQRGMQ